MGKTKNSPDTDDIYGHMTGPWEAPERIDAIERLLKPFSRAVKVSISLIFDKNNAYMYPSIVFF